MPRHASTAAQANAASADRQRLELPTRPEPSLRGVWILRQLAWGVPAVLFFSVPFAMLATLNSSSRAGPPPGFFALVLAVPFALVVLGIVAAMVGAAVAFRHYSFEIAPDHVTVRRGIFTKTETHVPMRRIQDVVVQQGVLLRSRGLHTLILQTAAMPGQGQVPGAGGVRLEGLRDGPRIAHYILQRVHDLKP